MPDTQFTQVQYTLQGLMNQAQIDRRVTESELAEHAKEMGI